MLHFFPRVTRETKSHFPQRTSVNKIVTLKLLHVITEREKHLNLEPPETDRCHLHPETNSFTIQ